MTNQKKYIGLSIVVVALIVAATIVFSGGEGDVGTAVKNGEPLNVPDNWDTFTSQQHNFSLKHPPQVIVSDDPEEAATLTLLGPNNPTGGSLTDGLVMTFTDEDYSASASLNAYVNEQYQQALQIEKSLQEPLPTTFHDQPAIAYVVGGSEGDTEHIYVAHGENVTLHITATVADPHNRGYGNVISTVFYTLSLSAEGPGTPVFNRVDVAFLNTEPEGEPERGCDAVVMVEREVTPTTQPLNEALRTLFGINEEEIDGNFNFIDRTNETLVFNRATIENGTANVFLSGELTGLQGACDNPRAAIQIEETALQFPGVDNVQIFLNGQPTTLTPTGA